MIEIEPVGNFIELELFDVYTDRYYLSQFQIMEENEEVHHANID